MGKVEILFFFHDRCMSFLLKVASNLSSTPRPRPHLSFPRGDKKGQTGLDTTPLCSRGLLHHLKDIKTEPITGFMSTNLS